MRIPPHDLVGENSITNETSAEVALNGVYSYIQGYGNLSAYYICDNELRTGLLDPTAYYRSKTEPEQLPRLQLLEDNTDVEGPWKVGYKIVNTASNFIYYTEQVAEVLSGRGRKQEMLAEAHFIRSFRPCFFITEIWIFLGYRQQVGDDYPDGTFFSL